jgi:hypothetical protein
LRLTPVSVEKIPILITQPIGKAPGDYLYLNVWPQHVTLTVKGHPELLKKLKHTGQKLTFNLSDISSEELDELPHQGDSVSFPIPNEWKKILLPALSQIPLEIDDPRAQLLRIDFTKKELLSLKGLLPLRLFYPLKEGEKWASYPIQSNEWVCEKEGTSFLSLPLQVKGVSRSFLTIVQHYLELVITIESTKASGSLSYSVQLIHPKLLEERYVAAHLSLSQEEIASGISLSLKEDYLRQQFRHYREQLELYYQHKPLQLKARLTDQKVFLSP